MNEWALGPWQNGGRSTEVIHKMVIYITVQVYQVRSGWYCIYGVMEEPGPFTFLGRGRSPN